MTVTWFVCLFALIALKKDIPVLVIKGQSNVDIARSRSSVLVGGCCGGKSDER